MDMEKGYLDWRMESCSIPGSSRDSLLKNPCRSKRHVLILHFFSLISFRRISPFSSRRPDQFLVFSFRFWVLGHESGVQKTYRTNKNDVIFARILHVMGERRDDAEGKTALAHLPESGFQILKQHIPL